MPGVNDFLTPEAMRKLDSLTLRSRYVVEGFRAGTHASPLKGASMEFADHRQYVKGDNLRHLDWKVFGRTERYYVKQFEQETNLRLHLVVDGSASMGFSYGGRLSKYHYACRLAASLGYLATKQHDSIGLTIYDSQLRHEIPTRSGMRHLRLILERLAAHRPDGPTNTEQALHTLAERSFRRGLIVILSDLFDDPEALFRAVAHFRKKLHDVILFQILDPAELELSFERVTRFVDMETGEKLEVDPDLARVAYKQELEASIEFCRSKCALLNVDFRVASTANSFEDFIHEYLVERRRLTS